MTPADDAAAVSIGAADTTDPAVATDPAVDGPAPAGSHAPPDFDGGGEGKKKKKRKDSRSSLGSNRSIETMFRTSYGELLGLTQMADAKASMMTSINGVVLSMLLAFSPSIIDSGPMLLIPCAGLLLTSLVSVVFSVLAATPRTSKANTNEPVDGGAAPPKGNLLYFGTMANMDREQFSVDLLRLLAAPEEVYLNMSRNLHGIGSGLTRKFRYVRYSYLFFIVGLCGSMGTFAVLVGQEVLLQEQLAAGGGVTAAVTPMASDPESLGYHRFDHMYEPSGVERLSQGRILVAEDDGARPFSLLRPAVGGGFLEDVGLPIASTGGEMPVVSDLEGLASDGDGWVYAVSSMSRDDLGREAPDRERLLRFKVGKEGLTSYAVFTGLRSSIASKHPLLAAASVVRNVKGSGGLNVEALAYDRTGHRLLVGLRGPRIDARAVVAVVDNPREIFDDGALPVVSPDLILVDLGGHAFRSMTWDANLDGYLVVGGPSTVETGDGFSLWLWDGGPAGQARRIRIQGHDGLLKVEGVTPFSGPEGDRLLLTVDDGSRKRGRTAHYLELTYGQLEIADAPE